VTGQTVITSAARDLAVGSPSARSLVTDQTVITSAARDLAVGGSKREIPRDRPDRHHERSEGSRRWQSKCEIPRRFAPRDDRIASFLVDRIASFLVDRIASLVVDRIASPVVTT
jgi:hypothetical protein